LKKFLISAKYNISGYFEDRLRRTIAVFISSRI